MLQDMIFAKALLSQNGKNLLMAAFISSHEAVLKQRLCLNVVGLCDWSCVMLGLKTWRVTESEEEVCRHVRHYGSVWDMKVNVCSVHSFYRKTSFG